MRVLVMRARRPFAGQRRATAERLRGAGRLARSVADDPETCETMSNVNERSMEAILVDSQVTNALHPRDLQIAFRCSMPLKFICVLFLIGIGVSEAHAGTITVTNGAATATVTAVSASADAPFSLVNFGDANTNGLVTVVPTSFANGVVVFTGFRRRYLAYMTAPLLASQPTLTVERRWRTPIIWSPSRAVRW